jgi:PTH1 family peptidyl-tRNA hydrolase
MNLSGHCVQSVANYYKIAIENLIVLHDDLDVKLGRVMAKVGGGSAGHNGLKSIDQSIGADYMRVRVGIGRPHARVDVSDYVLGKFSSNEREIIEILFLFFCKKIKIWMDSLLSLSKIMKL